MKVSDFIGEKAQFDTEGSGYIWGIKNGDFQMIGEVRGWGAIQNLFKEKGIINGEKAAIFQDELGKYIADAINEKMERERAAGCCAKT